MSTHRKASKSLKEQSAKPQAGVFYERAHDEIFHKKVWVTPKYYYKFQELQKQLNASEISARDYGYTIIKYLQGWASYKGLDHIPISMFCSSFAMRVYKRIQDRSFVRVVSTDDDFQAMVLYGELTLARYCISIFLSGHKMVGMQYAYKQLKPIIPEEWVIAADNDKRPIVQVARIIAEENGLQTTGIYGYQDVIEAIVDGNL
jgi:hypothetical protein